MALIPKLKQINSPNGRRYLIEGTAVKYPSITTVLGAVSDKSGLIAWRKRVGEEKANAISRNATIRGTSMHKLCEDYLSNNNLDDLGSPSGNMLFRGIRPLLDHIDNIRCLETALYSTKFRVAGTVDCIAEYKGKLSIIDFKTANKPKQEKWIEGYFKQGSFYFWSYYEITGEMPEQIVILISVEDGTTQEFVLEAKDVIKYSKLLEKDVQTYYNKYGDINAIDTSKN